MFKWISSMEGKVRSSLESVMSSKMAASLVRGAKVAVGYEVGYLATHVTNPTDLNQWKSAFVAGAFMGLTKYLTWKDSSQPQQ